MGFCETNVRNPCYLCNDCKTIFFQSCNSLPFTFCVTDIYESVLSLIVICARRYTIVSSFPLVQHQMHRYHERWTSLKIISNFSPLDAGPFRMVFICGQLLLGNLICGQLKPL